MGRWCGRISTSFFFFYLSLIQLGQLLAARFRYPISLAWLVLLYTPPPGLAGCLTLAGPRTTGPGVLDKARSAAFLLARQGKCAWMYDADGRGVGRGNAVATSCRSCTARHFDTQWIECECRNATGAWMGTSLDLGEFWTVPASYLSTYLLSCSSW